MTGWMAVHGLDTLACALLLALALAALRRSRLSTSRRLKLLVLLPLVVATAAQAGVFDVSAGLLAYVEKRWGRTAPQRVADWRARLVTGNGLGDTEIDRLVATNAYWNRVRYADDPRHWRETDYWATPVEMLGSSGGDCEDYVLGKYFTLRELGMPAARLRITYVRARGLAEGHMVLAYYATPDADPLVLDNLTDDILPASARTDLQPVYSFNDEDLWTAQSGRSVGAANQVRAWRELLDKMARERAL